jgi:hypothetical protein
MAPTIFSRCTTTSCSSLAGDTSLPIETWIVAGDTQELHRIQGIYSADFELSKLTVNYQGDIHDLPASSSPFDYCVGFLNRTCYERVTRDTKAVGSFAGRIGNFGFLDVVVEFEGEAPNELLCTMGVITIVRVIQAGSIGEREKE